MDLDSRKKPKIVFEKEVINTTSASISLTQESCLMQICGTSVKPISLGSVVHGKLWCSKHAIYPKGML
jgi:histone demethylase JARID1